MADPNDPDMASQWMALSFVLSDDPDSAETQLLLGNMSGFGTDWRAAEDGLATSVADTLATQKADGDTAQTDYDGDIQTATADHEVALASARAAYDTALATADSAYVASLGAAATTYQSDLTAFSGDTTSFEFSDFAFGESPAAAAWQFPADGDQPRPPVDAPAYAGPTYEWDADWTYNASKLAATAQS